MIQYTIAERKFMVKGETVTKYSPKIVRAATLDFDTLVALIAERTTIEEGEVRSFLLSLVKAIKYYVTSSFVVNIEGVGIFTPTLTARAVKTLEECTADTITKKGVIFRPTVKTTNKFKAITFKKANLDVQSV